MRYIQKNLLVCILLVCVFITGCGVPNSDIPLNGENLTESTENTEWSEVVGSTEGVEGTESTEVVQGTEDIQETESTEVVENTEGSENTEDSTQQEVVIDNSVLWIANCNEYINLRATASSDGTVLAQIPKGGQMKLLKWTGVYAKVAYQGKEGYVAANYIKPGSETIFQSSLDEVEITATYSYEEMLKDAKALADAYPELITLGSIGTSELGRDIPVLRIGKEDAKYHVLIHGGIHAREHMTSWLMMALVDYWADNNISSYGDVCYHIIPMVNPDGVVLVQTKELTELQKSIYQSDLNAGYTSSSLNNYISSWKANGLGLDLNRNFPAGWESVVYHENPSSWRYKGEEPFTAAETIALRDYTLAYEFDVTISYHATGSLIYYAYGYKTGVNTLSKSLGYAVKEETGYPMYGWGGATDGAGYKDWAMEYLEIPSLTVEIGCASAPLAEREAYSILARNRDVLPAIAKWLQR